MTFSRCDFADHRSAFDREWLVTNALGGFACGTVAQANTRRYHGLLVASLQPPVQRVVMVAKLEVLARYRAREYPLSCNEFADGTMAPRGLELLSSFAEDDGLPVWTYACADALLEQRVWMARGRNTTYLTFKLREAGSALALELRPLCTYRDYHAHTRGSWGLEVVPEELGCRVTAFTGAQPYRVLIDRGEFHSEPDWYWNFFHRAEAERGLDAQEDLFRPGTFRVRLEPGEQVTLIATVEPDFETPAAALDREQQRRRALLRVAPLTSPPWVRRLTLAADQ
ncbi:MAG: glycogen debranching enzyme N-terminal domain-containing protein, partial [Gammaproteobacteria bacterium]|nr:glycogen debranching enzyme N-terminal domain-containing protein [Gammaproteobacteria bacterium]